MANSPVYPIVDLNLTFLINGLVGSPKTYLHSTTFVSISDQITNMKSTLQPSLNHAIMAASFDVKASQSLQVTAYFKRNYNIETQQSILNIARDRIAVTQTA